MSLFCLFNSYTNKPELFLIVSPKLSELGVNKAQVSISVRQLTKSMSLIMS